MIAPRRTPLRLDCAKGPARSGPVGWLVLSWAAAVAVVLWERLGCAGHTPRTLFLTAAAAGAVGVAVGAVQYAAVLIGRRLTERVRRRGLLLPAAAGLAAASLSIPVVIGLATLLFDGRRLKGLPLSSVLLALVIVAGLLVVFCGVRAVVARVERRGSTVAGRTTGPDGRQIGVVSVLAAASLLLVTLEGEVLVRRYQWIHVTAQLAAFTAAQIAAWALFTRLSGPAVFARRAGAAAMVLFVFGATGWVSGRTLWKAEQEADRAAVFSCAGAGATVVEVFRPRPSAAAAGRLAAGVAGVAGERPPSPGSRREGAPPFAGSDVILVTVDALRADHLGFHGHSRPTSPALDALALESAVFERAYTPSPHTSYALASLHTGRHALALSRNGGLDAARTLADAFGAEGYRTVGIFPPAVFFVEGERFRALEKRRYGFERTVYQSLDETEDARVRTDQAIAVLDESSGARLFLWVHYFGPHEPYVRHPALGPDGEFGRKAVERYDGEIRWVDHHLGRLLEHVRSRRRPAIVVITADHGEEFGEHGGAYHGTSLHDEQIRVPLLVHLPGAPARRLAGPASTLDVAPTLARLVGLAHDGRFDGVDRSAALLGGDGPAPATPVFAELDHLKAVVAEGHKLICHTLRDYCQLFDLAGDPSEKQNIRGSQGARAARLRTVLDGWVRRSAVAGESDDPGRWTPAALLRAADRWDAEAVLGLGTLLGAEGTEATRPQQRHMALKIIARSPRPEHRAGLLRALTTDPDPAARQWAAIGLSLLGDPAGHATAGDLPPGTPGDPELAGYHALALAAARHEHAVIALARALHAVEDVSLRCKLLAAAGSIGGALATAVIISEYDHLRSRPCAAEALVATRSPQAVPFLAHKLRVEPYSTVRASVARALGHSGDRRAAWLLAEAYQLDGDDAVTAATAAALADLGHLQPTGWLRTTADRLFRHP